MLALILSSVPALAQGARRDSLRAERSDAVGVVRAFAIGTADARSGMVARGALPVPAGVDAGYDIPVIVINGARPGPTLALIAGLHGTEFGGIVALQRVASLLDPSGIAGRVIIIPVVNVASFAHLVPHLNPVDGKNMNRMFPGRVDGTQSERAAYVLTHEVLMRADYVVDYHGGDLDEDQRPYAYWIRTGEASRDSITHTMLRAFGINYLLQFAAAGLTPATANLLPTQAMALGKPTITVDAGRAGTYTAEDMMLLVDGTLNVMGQLGMLHRTVTLMTNAVYIERMLYVNSDQAGTFVPQVRRGEYVAAGGRLGYVTDVYGIKQFDAISPEAAVVLYLNSTPSVEKGGALVYLGVPARKAP
ncbi:MAG: succinylglutamate desuccinylase/aspartoacylase family protein [bacterium]